LRLLLPAGVGGPAFLVAANFNALLRYNPSTSYALAVGHLADRIGGGPALAAVWPERDRGLALAEREELQRLLAAAGHDPGPVDGLLGGLTRTALRSYQKQRALPQDGYPSVEVLERLRMERAGALP
jgi:membrane-bound lytic murein transglycosylase B